MKPNARLTQSALILLNAVGFALFSTAAGRGNDLDVRPAPSVEQVKFFESKIRPVLVQECYRCHSSKAGNAKGGLRLDNEQVMRLGGNSGPAVVPGDVDASLIYGAITYQDFEMPPKKRLSDAVVEDFRQWIEMGAPDPRKTEVAEMNSHISSQEIAEAKREFWAYQKPVLPSIPVIDNASWPRRELDRFVLAGLESAHLSPEADAEPNQVLRRLCYDLIGLPPSQEQFEKFDRAWKKNPDQAIEAMVDELLESPQYGERWGRHWLDLARYAESNGREVNMTNPHAWRYRDYVIDSFNADKPYDRFVQEQIAGDLLPAKDDAQWAQNLIATGFLALGPKSLSERNSAQFAADLADEQLDTTTRVMLGTSVACARCHDHKFEPIPQADYYALAGIFASTETYYGVPASEFGIVGAGAQYRNQSNLIRLPIDDPNPFDAEFTPQELERLTGQMQSLRQEFIDLRTASRAASKNGSNPKAKTRSIGQLQARAAAISNQLGGVDARGEPISYCMGVQESDRPRDARILVRGEIDQPAQTVPRDFPQVLRDAPAEIADAASGRRELAQWIASPDNPLTARVMVNRIWQHLLGAGIVASTEDFGSTGQAPSHPELLDYLALKFIDSGWSIKSMVREIATSRTYRLGSGYDPAKFERDPENRLLWRGATRQLDAEALRDSILFVAGRLDLQRPRASEVAKAGYMQVRDGSLINAGQLAATVDENGRREAIQKMLQQRGMETSMVKSGKAISGQARSRGELRRKAVALADGNSEYADMVYATYRSVYLPILRDELPRSLEVFDFAEPSMVVGQRETSSTPNQALFMLNNEFVILNSEALAQRVVETAGTPAQRLTQVFQLAYGRAPTSAERRAVRQFVHDFEANSADRGPSLATLIALSQSLFAAAEFRVID